MQLPVTFELLLLLFILPFDCVAEAYQFVSDMSGLPKLLLPLLVSSNELPLGI